MATMNTADTTPTKNVNQLKHEKAKARWSILRNALLQRATDAAGDESKHSIHRFSGYQLLRPVVDDTNSRHSDNHWTTMLQIFQWNETADWEENMKGLEIAVLALASDVSPKRLTVTISTTTTECSSSNNSWLKPLQERCQPAATVVNVAEKEDTPSSTGQSTKVTKLLVQAGRTATKYKLCQYPLDDHCCLWTREPCTMKLSLDDLVSHRTSGVDNTGNICVWDSERTLAYLLYHHAEDFPPAILNARKIVELGTGMAGLAAVSLGLQRSKRDPETTCDIALTDGNEEGVKNNLVNQYFTKAWFQQQTACHQRYKQMTVTCQRLLWTTDLVGDDRTLVGNDLILVSDCTHFQQFHAALVITTLRSLRVGGMAIFCQPHRSNSLTNFLSLLQSVPGLASHSYWTHTILDSARQKHGKDGVYDENLHHPVLLLVNKLRPLTQSDCVTFVEHQEQRGKG